MWTNIYSKFASTHIKNYFKIYIFNMKYTHMHTYIYLFFFFQEENALSAPAGALGYWFSGGFRTTALSPGRSVSGGGCGPAVCAHALPWPAAAGWLGTPRSNSVWCHRTHSHRGSVCPVRTGDSQLHRACGWMLTQRPPSQAANTAPRMGRECVNVNQHRSHARTRNDPSCPTEVLSSFRNLALELNSLRN